MLAVAPAADCTLLADSPPAPTRSKPSLLVGQVLGQRYRLERRIASGGTSDVYAATHVTIGKPVAVKVLSPLLANQPSLRSCLLHEAQLLCRIVHENVVDVCDYGETPDGSVFLVMELLDGVGLDVIIDRGEPIAWHRMRSIMFQICEAVAAAHAAGVVHRDLKPENCMVLRRENGEESIKVIDFGIAVPTDGCGGLPWVCGTPAYMAPEQIRGESVDIRTDIYALGILLYELCTGHVPFVGEDPQEVITQQLYRDPTPPGLAGTQRGMPAQLEAVIMRALSKEPEKRYPDIESFMQALAGIPDEPSVVVPALVATPVTKQRRLERRLILVTALLTVVAVLQIAVVVLLCAPDGL